MLWFFFFFKQKTAYEMRISDWSSDVCSSDLLELDHLGRRRRAATARFGIGEECAERAALAKLAEAAERQAITIGDLAMAIFRASGERPPDARSEEHTSELQSLMRISYAVFCLKKKKTTHTPLSRHTPPVHTIPYYYYNIQT